MKSRHLNGRSQGGGGGSGDGGDRRSPAGAMLALAALCQAGCHLYSAGNDRLAQLAQSSLGDAKLGAGLDDERELVKKMGAAEASAIRLEVAAQRDEALARILDAYWSGFEAPLPDTGDRCPALGVGPRTAPTTRAASVGKSPAGSDKTNAAARAAPDPRCYAPWSKGESGSMLCEIDGRIDRLVGGAGPVDLLADLRAARSALVSANERLAGVELRAGTNKKLPSLSCPAEGDLPDPKALSPDVFVQELIRFFQLDCQNQRAAKKTLTGLVAQVAAGGGVLGQTEAERARMEELIAAQTGAARKLAAAYGEAKRAFDEATAKGTATKDALDEAIKKLKDLEAAATGVEKRAKDVDALVGSATGTAPSRALPIANPFAEVEALQARYDALSATVASITDGKPAADAPLALALSTALTLAKIDGERRLPALLLESERLRGELDVARVRAAHLEKQLALLGVASSTLFDEAWELVAAHQGLTQAICGSCARPDQRVYASFSAAKGDCRQQLAAVLTHYGASWTVGEMRSRLARAAVRADRHEAAIDLSEAALRQWQNLLAVPMGLVAKYHAGGVRPEDVARFLGAIGSVAGFAGLSAATVVK